MNKEKAQNPWKVGIVILAVLLLSVGLINYHYLRDIDKQYSLIISDVMAHADYIQKTSLNSSAVLTEYHRLLTAGESGESEKILSRISSLVAMNDEAFNALKMLIKTPEQKSRYASLMNKREKCVNDRMRYMKLLKSGDVVSAKKLIDLNLATSSNEYINEQILFSRNIRIDALEHSNRISDISSKVSRLTVGIIMLPFIVVIFSLIYVIVTMARLFSDYNNNGCMM